MASSRYTEKDSRIIIQQIECKQQQVTDESLDSTRRMLSLCVESTDHGAATLVMLDSQDRKLNSVGGDLTKITMDAREAEKNLTKMQRCCGLDLLSCQNGSSKKNDEAIWNNGGNGKVVKTQPKNRRQKQTEIKSQVCYIERITNDAREDEMEETMGQVNNLVGDLRNMAINISEELDGQNKKIERINLHAERNAIHIEKVNQQAKHLL